MWLFALFRISLNTTAYLLTIVGANIVIRYKFKTITIYLLLQIY